MNKSGAWSGLIVAALAAYYALLAWLIYSPPHVSLQATGAGSETGPVYGFWSGFGGTLLFSAMVLFPPWYYKQTCHDHFSCLRWGSHPAAGGTFSLCWKHHPDMGVRPHSELISRLHLEHKNRGRGS